MERITADHRQIYAFSAYLKESEKSAATVEKYVHDVCVFYAFVGDREIDKQAVLDYKAYLGNHYAVASANSMIAALFILHWLSHLANRNNRRNGVSCKHSGCW